MADLFQSIVKAGTAAAKAIGEVPGKIADEWTDDFERVEEAFAQEGLAGGVVETLDALSIGNIVQNNWTAFGLVPNDDRAEALVKAALNGVCLNPVALKNLLDAGQVPEKPSVGRCGPPKTGYAGPRCDPYGVGGRHPSPRDVFAKSGCFTTPFSGVSEALDQRDGGCVVGRPAKDTPIADILNDTSLCFEDMLALVMMAFCAQQQREIRAQIDKLEGMFGTGAAAQAGEALDGAACGNLDADGVKDLVRGIKPFLPIILPLLCGALTAIVPAGPLVAAALPVVLPMLLDLVESGALDGVLQGPSKDGEKKDGASKAGARQGATKGAASSSSGTAGSADDEAAKKEQSDMRTLEFEKLKLLTTQMSEMQQALSNVLNTQHETAMGAIRNIRA